MTPKTRVLFLIQSLVAHGAERQLIELVRAMDPASFEIHVAVFYDATQIEGTDLTPELLAIPHVTYHGLHKRRGGLGNLLMLPKLFLLALRLNPHIIHGYMDGNLPALLVGRTLGCKVAWGIRRSNADLQGIDAHSLGLLRWTLRLSRFVHLIVYNSQAGLISHESLGMRPHHAAVIPNGFDVVRFTPDAQGGAAQRRAWGIPEGAPLIGIVGRLDPVKGHAIFIEAASQVLSTHPEAWFVCIGGGSQRYLAEMRHLADAKGLGQRLLWPGASDRMPEAYNALDILALASLDEGFPNVLGEAMACGVPCVATGVGDAEMIVGSTGFIVPPSDPNALSSALCRLLGEDRTSRQLRSASCRVHVVQSFGTHTLARRTEQALLSLLSSFPHRPVPTQGS